MPSSILSVVTTNAIPSVGARKPGRPPGKYAEVIAARERLLKDGLKLCAECSNHKPVSSFYKKRDTYDCLNSRCIDCIKVTAKNSKALRRPDYAKYLENIKANELRASNGVKRCSTCGQDKPADRQNFSAMKSTRDGLHCVCKQCDSIRLYLTYQANPERAKLIRKTYVAKNKRKVYEATVKWKKSSPLRIFATRMREFVRSSVKRRGFVKTARTQEIIGCNWEFFQSHIERQFLKGMTWEKMGSEIHIDHITPISTAKTQEDVIALSHFTNLRPMWAADNFAKGATITHLI